MKTTLLIMIFLPVIAGILLPVVKPNRGLRRIWVTAVLAVEAAAALWVVVRGEGSFVLFSMTETLTVGFSVDALSKLFAAIAAFGWLLVGIYSFKYIEHEGRDDMFFCFFLVVEGMLFGMDFSSNLISMYLFYEMITLTSMPLVLHSLSKESINAALKYLFYSVAGAFLALFGIFFMAKHCSTLDFVPGGSFMGESGGWFMAAVFFAIVGFGAKAGMYPLHGWLPSAHPVAPGPASAVLSGIIAKAGVLAVIRVIFYVVGADVLRGTWVQYTCLALSLLTVFMGSMMAYREQLFKKRLAYSTVSQISYVMTGLFFFNEAGLIGALMHILFHATIKVCLFLCAGSVIHSTGKTRVDELRGIGKEMPVTIWSFTLASLSLVGIPPAAGFVSKWFLAEGALFSGVSVFSWLAPVVLLISALLTAGYLLPITIGGFFPGKSYSYPAKKCETPALMWVPVAVLAAAAILLGVFSSGLSAQFAAIASSII